MDAGQRGIQQAVAGAASVPTPPRQNEDLFDEADPLQMMVGGAAEAVHVPAAVGRRESCDSILSVDPSVNSASSETRPKTLSLGGGFQSARHEQLRRRVQNEPNPATAAGSLMGPSAAAAAANMQRPRFSIYSAPATPMGSIGSLPSALGIDYIDREYDDDEEYYLECTSIASCEETTEATAASKQHRFGQLSSPSRGFKKRNSKSRLSLNLGSKNSPSPVRYKLSPPEGSEASNAAGNTRGILPKFLRSSFSRLFQNKNNNNAAAAPKKDETPITSTAPTAIAAALESESPPSALAALAFKKSSTFQNLVNAAAQAQAEAQSDACNTCTCHSPTTEAYLEETKLNGLPVIPFAFPTSVVAEKQRNRNKKLRSEAAPSGPATSSPSSSNKRKETSSPQDILSPASSCRRNTSLVEMDHLNPDDLNSDFEGPKSLENLVYIAQRELMSESLRGGGSNASPSPAGLGFLTASASSMETTTNSMGSDADDDVGLMFAGGGNKPPVPSSAAAATPRSSSVLPRRPATSDDGYFEMAPPKRPSPSSRRSSSSATTNSSRPPQPPHSSSMQQRRSSRGRRESPSVGSSGRRAVEEGCFEMDLGAGDNVK